MFLLRLDPEEDARKEAYLNYSRHSNVHLALREDKKRIDIRNGTSIYY